MIFTCSKININEWSGRLYYTIDEISPDFMTITLSAKDILILDEGTTGYTEYKTDSRTTDYMMNNLHLMECKIAHLHSHNSMGVFFSGTDIDELKENAINFDFYLSVIVNNNFDVIAKAVIAAEDSATTETRPITVKALGKELVIDSVVHEVKPRIDIVRDVYVSYLDFGREELIEQITQVKAAKETKRKAHTPVGYKPNVLHLGGKLPYENEFFLEEVCVCILYGESLAPKNIDIPMACLAVSEEIDLAYIEENLSSIVYDAIETIPAISGGNYPLQDIYKACLRYLNSRIPAKYEKLNLELTMMFEEAIAQEKEDDEDESREPMPSLFDYHEDPSL